MVGKDDNMKSRKFIAMMLAVMLTAASAAGPAFAAENSAQTAGTEQTSGAVFEDGTRDESQEKTRFTFTSSNTRAATADAAGTVTGKSAGTVTTTAKAAETADYKYCQQGPEETRQLPLYQVEQFQVHQLPDRLE